MFVRDEVQADDTRQLRLVEDYFARKHPDFLERVDTRRALLSAYGATCVAPVDTVRQLDVLHSRGDGITPSVLDAALAAARTPDDLHAVCTQIQSLPINLSSLETSIPSLQKLYALHLAPLGAHNEAVTFDVDESIGWYVGQPTSSEEIHKRNIADTLRRNGLLVDDEDVLWILSAYSPYREFLLVQGTSEQTRPADRVDQQGGCVDHKASMLSSVGHIYTQSEAREHQSESASCLV